MLIGKDGKQNEKDVKEIYGQTVQRLFFESDIVGQKPFEIGSKYPFPAEIFVDHLVGFFGCIVVHETPDHYANKKR